MTGVRRVLGWCWRLALWLVAGTALAALALGVLVPRLAGATPYAVLTGSMRPDLPPGTLVVVRPVEPADLATGDVITYQLESGRPAVVTHRIAEVRATLTGEVEWRTQGDANPIPDREWVRPEQVRGELWYAVPWLGRAGFLLTGDQRQLAVRVVAGGLALYAAVALLGSLRTRGREAPAEQREEVRV